MPLSSRWAIRILSNCEPESGSKSTPPKQPLPVILYSNKNVIPSGEIRSSVLTTLNLRHIDTHYDSLDLECSSKGYMPKVWPSSLALLGYNETFRRLSPGERRQSLEVRP